MRAGALGILIVIACLQPACTGKSCDGGGCAPPLQITVSLSTGASAAPPRVYKLDLQSETASALLTCEIDSTNQAHCSSSNSESVEVHAILAATSLDTLLITVYSRPMAVTVRSEFNSVDLGVRSVTPTYRSKTYECDLTCHTADEALTI